MDSTVPDHLAHRCYSHRNNTTELEQWQLPFAWWLLQELFHCIRTVCGILGEGCQVHIQTTHVSPHPPAVQKRDSKW